MTSESTTPPPRPTGFQQAASLRLFFALAPRLPRRSPPPPPPELAPFETLTLPRGHGPGGLSATWYPAAGEARGAVLLLHPWLAWGRAYFHRHGRLEALRQAGFHTLTPDMPGFGASGRRAGFFDLDVGDALTWLAERCPGLPLHVWGVSSGGYWAHPALSGKALSRRTGGENGDVTAAFFEDVAPHLLEWSWRVSPWGRPAYAAFRLLFRRAYRYLDLRRHAPHLGARRVAFVSGRDDHGVRPDDTRELAHRAGAAHRIVSGAGHLEAIKQDREGVIGLALATFSGA